MIDGASSQDELPDLVLVVDLPLPPHYAHPNRRPHSRTAAIVLSKEIKAARSAAWLVTKKAMEAGGARKFPWPPAQARLVTHWRLAGRQDDDNLLAWSKCYRDGISDAIQLNDRHMTSIFGSQAVARDAAARGVRIEVQCWRRKT